MTTATGPQGFTPVEADRRAPTIDKDDLRKGVIVRHVGSRYVDENSAKGFRHTFKTRGGLSAGMLFETWGTAELNSMIKKLRAGAVIYLRYGGKEPHPELPGADVHKWEVGDSRSSEITPALRDLIAGNDEAQRELERKIAEAKDRERARFEQRRADAGARGEQPPEHTDDDLPF
jgi:hypothetical protein